MRSIRWRHFQWSWGTTNYPKPPHFPQFLLPVISSLSWRYGRQIDQDHRWQTIPERGVVEVTWTIKILVGTNHIFEMAAACSCSCQILYKSRLYLVPGYGWQITHKKGIVRITWPIWNFGAHNDISGTTEARVVNFANRQTISLSSPSFQMTNHPKNGRGKGHMTQLSISMPAIVFPERLKRESPNIAHRYNTSNVNHEITKYPQRATLIGNCMRLIKWHHSQCHWMTLKVTFAVWNFSGCHTSRNLAQIY